MIYKYQLSSDEYCLNILLFREYILLQKEMGNQTYIGMRFEKKLSLSCTSVIWRLQAQGCFCGIEVWNLRKWIELKDRNMALSRTISVPVNDRNCISPKLETCLDQNGVIQPLLTGKQSRSAVTRSLTCSLLFWGHIIHQFWRVITVGPSFNYQQLIGTKSIISLSSQCPWFVFVSLV